MKPVIPNEKPPSGSPTRPTWQEYQSMLKRQGKRKKNTHRLLRWTAPLLILAASLYGLAVGIDGFSSTPGDLFETKPAESARDLPEPVLSQGTPTSAPDLGKDDENFVWESPPFPNKIQSEWTVRHGSQRLKVETTLDDSLQEYLTGKLDRKLSKQIAVVVMEPTTGRVLALAGHDRARPSNNPCLDSGFPAASIFKIVTASAAVEQHGFKPETVFVYSGQKHTLYKSQLKDKKSKYSRRITLRDSFAQSVNPVFGKLGVYHLELSQIKDYARAFGFGEAIEFELGKPQSRLWVSEDSFGMAEIASGFNRKTTLSPLHGALIASAVINGGSLMAPTFIDRVTNGKGETVYRGKPSRIRTAISSETASVLTDLMQATIRSGTSRKAFTGYRYDKVLSRLVIGGKTGSISNLEHTSKYDWFVGFAKDKKAPESIAVSVLVVHGDKVGRKAGSYARLAIRAYYDAYFSGKSASSGSNERS